MLNLKHRRVLSVFLVNFSLIVIVSLGTVGGCGSDGNGGMGKSDAEIAFENADLVRGGLLYDRWWGVNDADEPPGNGEAATNPNYPSENNEIVRGMGNARDGSQTYRCKECHGWDYLGAEGAYGQPNSHYTGIEGVLEVSDLDAPDLIILNQEGDHTIEELYNIIRNGGASGECGDIMCTMLGFSQAQLSDADIWDLVKFLKNGVIDYTEFIDPETGEPIDADLENGEDLYNDVCAVCHGMGGETMEFGEDECVREIAEDNPWEFSHKVRFGQPGTQMPSSIDNGWSILDVMDVLAYAQTLPEDCEGLPPDMMPPDMMPPLIDAQQLFDDNCLACHGPDGDGTGFSMVNIMGENASEIAAAIDENKGGMGAIMLTDEELNAIADEILGGNADL